MEARRRLEHFPTDAIVGWSPAQLLAPETTRLSCAASERPKEQGGSSLKTDQQSQPKSRPRFEPLDVPAFLPFWLAALLAAFVGGVLLYISLAFPLATNQQSRGPLKPLPPAPRLLTAPEGDLQRYETAKAQELKGSRGSLPIEAAMEETAKQGWGPPK